MGKKFKKLLMLNFYMIKLKSRLNKISLIFTNMLP